MNGSVVTNGHGDEILEGRKKRREKETQRKEGEEEAAWNVSVGAILR